jgi:NAD-dependent deacetylase
VARGRAEKVLNCLDIGKVPFGFSFLRGNATSVVPRLVEKWLGEAR